MPITGYSNTISVTTAFDADALAYINALSADGYPLEAPEQTYINTLVTDFKNAGIWSKMKAIYPYCTSQRNLIGYSEDFGNGYWEKAKNGTGITPIVSVNSIVAPNGTTTASRIQFDRGAGTSSSDFSLIYNQGVITLSSAGVYSFYAKSQTGSNQTLLVYWGGGQGTTFTLTTDWQRFQINNLSVTSDAIVFGTRAGSGAYYNGGQQVLDIAVWHPQLELGSTATTYQPVATTASTIFASQFKYNLKDPRNLDAAFRQVFNGGWTYSKQGATPNGVNGYADTNYLMGSSNGFSNNNYHLSYYSRTNNSSVVEMGVGIVSPLNFINLYLRLSGNIGASQGSRPDFSISTANSLGLGLISGLSSTLGKLYKNGSLLQTQTQTQTATSEFGVNMILGGQFYNGAAADFTNRQCAFSSIGNGLTDTEASAMYTSVQNYNTSMSRAV